MDVPSPLPRNVRPQQGPRPCLPIVPYVPPQHYVHYPLPPRPPLPPVMPYVPQDGPYYVEPIPSTRSESLRKQIEYYFSKQNLCKDVFLRSHMDGDGWVDLCLIADFPMVVNHTTHVIDKIRYIRASLCISREVEVQEKRIRKTGDWKKWILPPHY